MSLDYFPWYVVSRIIPFDPSEEQFAWPVAHTSFYCTATKKGAFVVCEFPCPVCRSDTKERDQPTQRLWDHDLPVGCG